MSTVSEVVDRVYREYLRPAGDYPLHAMLTTTLNTTDTSVVFDDGYLQAEDMDLIVEGLRIEIGSELMQVTGFTEGSRTMTVTRAVEGTTAAAHTQAVDNIYFAPEFPRKKVEDAVMDEVPRLWPSLWRVASEYMPRADGLEVNALAESIQQYRIRSSQGWVAVPAQLLKNHPESSTGNLIQFDRSDGAEGYLTYRARFARPTAVTDDLTLSTGDWTLRPEWEQILVVGAAAYIIASADIEKSSQEFLTESFETQGFPVPSGERVSRALFRYRDELLAAAHRGLLKSSPPAGQVMSGMVFGAP